MQVQEIEKCIDLFGTNIYIAILISGICFYIGLSGIAITIIGMKRTKIKENMNFYVQERGALV